MWTGRKKAQSQVMEMAAVVKTGNRGMSTVPIHVNLCGGLRFWPLLVRAATSLCGVPHPSSGGFAERGFAGWCMLGETVLFTDILFP